MPAHIGLYFPYFHFPNDDWVKVSALYWDKMYRIVPDDYETKRDTDVVKKLSERNIKRESLFISNVAPEGFYEDLHDIGNQFIKLIENHTDVLVHHYGVEQRDQWETNEYTAKYSSRGDTRLAYIYSEKINYELSGILEKRGLGTRRSNVAQDVRWMGMHPKLANIYMSALAEKLASRTQSHPITNDAINYFAVAGFTFERLAQVMLDKTEITKKTPTEDELEARLAIIALRAVMPKNITDVSIDQILELREKYSGQFGKFQDFLHSIVEQLPSLKSITGEQFINDHLDAEYKKNIKPQIDELDDAMNSIGIETIPTILNVEVKVPALFTSGALLVGAFALNPLLGSTATVAMALAKIIGEKRKVVKGEIKKSDIAYLMNIRDDLTPAGSLDWLNIQSRKLLFGI